MDESVLGFAAANTSHRYIGSVWVADSGYVEGDAGAATAFRWYLNYVGVHVG